MLRCVGQALSTPGATVSDLIAIVDIGTVTDKGFFEPTHRIDAFLWDRAALMLYPAGSTTEPIYTWLPERPSNHLRDILAMVRLHVGGMSSAQVLPELRRKKVTLTPSHEWQLDHLADHLSEMPDLCLQFFEDNPGELEVERHLQKRLKGVEVRMVNVLQSRPRHW